MDLILRFMMRIAKSARAAAVTLWVALSAVFSALAVKLAKLGIVRKILLPFCALVFVAGFFFAAHRPSAIMTITAALAAAAIMVFWEELWELTAKIRRQRIGRVVTNIIAIGVLAAVLYVVVISGFMLSALPGDPPEGATLVILGCQVRGEEPSLMLYRRMNAALRYMRVNPASVAILSGGQGPGEWITEAEAMRRYITANGISEDRLYLEDRSTSTRENIMFSKEIIEAEGLSYDVAIITDSFHQFRAQIFARGAGLSPSAISARTTLFTIPYYWLREIMAVSAQIILGLELHS